MPEAGGQTVVNLRQKILLEKLYEKIKLIGQMQAQDLEASEVIAEEIRHRIADSRFVVRAKDRPSRARPSRG